MKKKLLLSMLIISCVLSGCAAKNAENPQEEDASASAYSGSETQEVMGTLPEGLPEDFTLIPEQTFDVTTDEWGAVRFISGYVGQGFSNDLRFYYANDKKVLYEFPSEEENFGLLDSIQEVAFQDITGDGKKDVIIIYTYFFGAGPQGAIPRTMSRIYMATENGYQIDTDLENEIMDNFGAEEYTAEDISAYVLKKQ